MRTMTSITLAAVLALVLGASQASATSSIELRLLTGGSGGAPCTNGTEGVDCTHANESDILKFAMVVNVDSLGMALYSFDLRWDEDGEDELDLVGLRTRANLIFTGIANPTPPPATTSATYMVFGPDTSQASTPGNGGFAYNIAGASTSPVAPFPSDVSFRVGVVSFHVNGNLNKNAGPDIELGFHATPILCDFAPCPPGGFVARFVAAGGNGVTPNFGSFTVDSIPEPGPSLFVGMGVLSLIWVRRACRKR